MNTKKKLALGIGLAAFVGGLIVYLAFDRRKKRRLNEQMSEQVADEGYETAHDILFPAKSRKSPKYGYRQAFH